MHSNNKRAGGPVLVSAGKPFFVYILASKKHGTLYTGSTDNLGKRVSAHKQKTIPGFTAKYNVSQLVWFEAHETREGARLREAQIKKWKRDWKTDMIERENPDWCDLYEIMAL